MSTRPIPAPTDLAHAERLLMRWPRSPRLLRLVKLGRIQQQRAEARARGYLMAGIREGLKHADLTTLRAVLNLLWFGEA